MVFKLNLSNHLKVFVIDEITGERLCACGCGYVVEEKMPILSIQEDLHKDSKNSNLRIGPQHTNLMHDGGLSTVINKFNVDVNKSKISTENKVMFYRLRTYDKWSTGTSNNPNKRLMYNGLQQLQRICDTMGFNYSFKENAGVFYKKIVSTGLSKGRKVEYFAAVCCYLICKQLGMAITIHDFADKLQLSSKTLFEYDYLISSRTDFTKNTNSPTTAFVTQFANKLSMKNNVVLLAIRIIDLATVKGLTGGKNPKTIAAAALYLACNDIYGKASSINHSKRRFSSGEIADVSEIHQPSIRSAVYEIKELVIQEGLIKP